MENKRNYQKLAYWVPYLVFALVIILVMNSQLRHHITIIVGDGYFHFTRIYDAAQQIRTHNFSYFQMNWGFDQSGRMVNAVYGPMFAYLMGFLLLLSGSWFKFQILTGFLISFAAAAGMYQLMKKVNNNLFVDTLVSLVYLCQISWWNQGATFGSISAMMLPYVLLVAVRMIQNWQKPISWLQLGLTMSIVAQIHLMSTLLFTIMLIPFAIAGFCHTDNKKAMIYNFLGAVGITLVLTANVWGALIYFHLHDVMANPIETNMAISAVGWANMSELFWGLAIFQIIYVLFHLRESLLNNIVTLTGTIFLVISTNLMPWNAIQTAYPVLRSTFQVPRRLMIEAIPLLLLGAGITIKFMVQRDHNDVGTWCAFLIVMLLVGFNSKLTVNNFYTNTSIQSTMPMQYEARANNNGKIFYYRNVPAPDYLPQVKNISGTKKAALYEQDVIKRQYQFEHLVLPGGRLELKWFSPKISKVKLPIVMYRDSHLIVNNHVVKHPNRNEIGVPTVNQVKGKNKAILSFQAPNWWQPLLWIVSLSWLLIICLALYNRLRHC
ncbi:hypothetical protein NR996_05595 [Lactobacillus rodentium]|uniref:Cell division protein n=1 Tax=Lactobacillus rodentium TaxID=947835 RepID=A0A2Z6TGR9_9LACO|nr:hypothetical protein [Lactobacillus rodentium]MCR1894883.1 hypothetical protein [Lactobacillus rodentium]GBG05282.1 hypothetical protein LrDSM24759_11960 [Lactobacillus rodentium]